MVLKRLFLILSLGVGLPALFAQSSIVVSVADFGAVPNDDGDDTDAIDRAQQALPPRGGIVFFPAGTYLISKSGIVLKRENAIFRGCGMWTTTLKRQLSSQPIVQSSFPLLHGVAFEDLSFDWDFPRPGPGNTVTMALYGTGVADFRISRCRFWRAPSNCIALAGVSNIVIEDSLFHSPGDANSTAIAIGRGGNNIVIRRNRFLYLRDGIIIDTGPNAAGSLASVENVDISRNYFDLAWWLIANKYAGEGDGVRYTENGLIDTGAAFDVQGLAPYLFNIRVMPLRQAGVGRYRGRSIEDADAHFLASGVRRGDLVRAGAACGVVEAVDSDSRLYVEEWQAQSDRLAVDAPPNGTPYKVYGIYIGTVLEGGKTTFKTDRWFDLDGKSVRPKDGTRYEVLVRRPNYALNAEAGVDHITVRDNTFRRGWSDQVSLYGNNATVVGNLIEDGEDMGITLHGKGNLVQGNQISHQGAGGIYADTVDSVISSNVVRDSQWVNTANRIYLGDIILYNADRTLVDANLCERTTAAFGYHGIVVFGRDKPATDNVLTNNVSRNHLLDDIYLRGEAVGGVIGLRSSNNMGVVGRFGKVEGLISEVSPPLRVSSPPLFLQSLPDQDVNLGGSIKLVASASGNPIPSYQWFHLLEDNRWQFVQSGPAYEIVGAKLSDGGRYRVVAFNNQGRAESEMNLAVKFSQLVNLSAGAMIPPEGDLICGLILAGAGHKRLLLRAAGESLAGFGYTKTLATPRLTLTSAKGAPKNLANQGWDGSSTLAAVFAKVGAFPFQEGSFDAALATYVVADGFTNYVTRVDGRTVLDSGRTLVELYDAEPAVPEVKVANMAVLGYAGCAGDELTTGFTIRGNVSKRLLVRVIGPGLEKFGVQGFLKNPQLTLFDLTGKAVLGRNDDWSGSNELRAAFSATGAFPLPNDSLDSALVVTVAPGAYSVVVSDQDEAGGTVLVEVYDLG